MKKTTFIHTADLHLDSPMIGLSGLPNHIFKRVRESTFKAFKAVTDEAIRRHVDFIIFAGDLFDGEDRSIRAQAHFRNEMERLGQHGIQAFVIHGNHDHLNGSWHHLSMPGNVHVFTQHVEYKAFQNESGAVVYLYGFSYPERHIYDDMTPYYHKALGADFHIGILHGHNEGGSEHSRYAPFKVNNLLHKQFDYWALGHIHKRTILHDEPYIVYPGNIQGRNRSELGMKGCYAVTLEENSTHLQFNETSDVIWEEVYLDGKSIHHLDDVYRLCHQCLDEMRREGKGIIVTITINNIQNADFLDDGVKTELLELLQEEEQAEESFVFPIEIRCESGFSFERNVVASEAEFYQELFDVIDHCDDIDQVIAPLFEHYQGRKYVEKLSVDEKQQIVREAEALLVKKLYKDDGK